MLPILETYRCLLRQVNIEDINDMYEYASDERVVKYLAFAKHESTEATKNVTSNFFINRYEQGI